MDQEVEFLALKAFLAEQAQSGELAKMFIQLQGLIDVMNDAEVVESMGKPGETPYKLLLVPKLKEFQATWSELFNSYQQYTQIRKDSHLTHLGMHPDKYL